MTGVIHAPGVERRESQHARNDTPESVRPSGAEKRTVAAVMKNDKDAYQKSGRQQDQRQCQQDRVIHDPPDQDPEGDIRNQRVGELPDAFKSARLPIGRNLALQRPVVDGGGDAVALICLTHPEFSSPKAQSVKDCSLPPNTLNRGKVLGWTGFVPQLAAWNLCYETKHSAAAGSDRPGRS